MDIASYMGSAPDNVEFDRSPKEYVATPRFIYPRYFEPDARKYLTQLLLLADNALAQSESWLGTIPSHDAVARVRRKLFRRALTADRALPIRKRQAIEIEYQSFSVPQPWKCAGLHRTPLPTTVPDGTPGPGATRSRFSVISFSHVRFGSVTRSLRTSTQLWTARGIAWFPFGWEPIQISQKGSAARSSWTTGWWMASSIFRCAFVQCSISSGT